MRLDRRSSRRPYPADYGFVPDTLAEDGDPLGALVLLEDPTFPGCWVRARPGRVLDGGREGRRRQAHLRALGDPLYEQVQDLAELRHLLDEIEHFFNVYKTLEPDARTHTRGYEGRDAAWAEIDAASDSNRCPARRDTRLAHARSCTIGRLRSLLWVACCSPGCQLAHARSMPRRPQARARGPATPATGGSWLPCSTISSSTTKMRSALRAVGRRWAMSRVVRPLATTPSRWARASVLRSRLAVASSSSRIAGSTSSARETDQLLLAGRERPPRSVTGCR